MFWVSSHMHWDKRETHETCWMHCLCNQNGTFVNIRRPTLFKKCRRWQSFGWWMVILISQYLHHVAAFYIPHGARIFCSIPKVYCSCTLFSEISRHHLAASLRPDLLLPHTVTSVTKKKPTRVRFKMSTSVPPSPSRSSLLLQLCVFSHWQEGYSTVLT